MQLGLRVASWLSGFLLTVLKPLFWLRDRKPRPRLPPATNPLLNFSAVELAKKIRHREITSESVVAAYIERIKAVNPFVNAVVDERFEAALSEARHCDKIIEAGELTVAQLESHKPFFGVPFTVKESCGLKGLSYTGCTVVRSGIKAEEDSLIVKSMKNAGAIAICATNTPELCSGFESTNPLYGTTVNPYDGRHSAGGSSGGEGALLGAGASLIGIGSDIGGSIRVPALFNGVFGHKPTPKIIPIKGHFPMVESDKFQFFLTLGPMTRYVEDLHLSVKIMSAGCQENLRLDEPVDISKLRVMCLDINEKHFGIAPTNSEIKNAIQAAAIHLESRGAKISKPVIEELAESYEIGVASFFSMKELPPILIHPTDPKKNINAAQEYFKSLVGCSKYSKPAIFMAMVKQFNGLLPPSQVPHYLEKFNSLQKKILELLNNDGVLLYPSFISAAPPLGQSVFQTTVGACCLLCNILGLPSTQVPMGLNSKGLPIGFQIIAAPYQDRLSLAVAAELSKAFGGWVPPLTS